MAAASETPALPYTIAELDHAISWAFKFDAMQTMARMASGRPSAHQAAMIRAFVDDVGGPNADILRQAWYDLERRGAYQPSDGFWPDNDG